MDARRLDEIEREAREGYGGITPYWVEAVGELIATLRDRGTSHASEHARLVAAIELVRVASDEAFSAAYAESIGWQAINSLSETNIQRLERRADIPCSLMARCGKCGACLIHARPGCLPGHDHDFPPPVANCWFGPGGPPLPPPLEACPRYQPEVPQPQEVQ